MLDLFAHVFYKAHFTVESLQKELDIPRFLVMNIVRDWIRNKYKKDYYVNSFIDRWNWEAILTGCDLHAGNISIHSVCYSPAEKEYALQKSWACTIKETQERSGYASRKWVTEIGFQQTTNNSGIFSYIVYYLNGTSYFGLTQDVPISNIPNVIKKLFESTNIKCHIGGVELNTSYENASIGSANKLAEFILSPNREIPIILITADSQHCNENGYPQPSIYPKDMVEQVAGNAIVYYAKNPEFSEELSYFLPPKYWCRSGLIRAYLPNIDINDISDSRRHRYFTPDNVSEIGQKSILSIFRRLFSREIEYLDEQQMFRCENVEHLIQQEKSKMVREEYNLRLEEEKSKSHENETFYSKYIDQLEQELSELRGNEATVKQLTDELRFEKSRFESRTTEINALYRSTKQMEAVLSSIQRNYNFPDSPLRIADYYEALYGDKIGFTKRAKNTLKDCNTSPELLWNCFFHMATTLRNLYIDNNPDIASSFQGISGFELARGEGKATRENKALMKLRDDEYQGRTIHAEPHVKKGNRDADPLSVRVYYAFDVESQKIIVSYCNGRHLDNASTRYI